MDTLIKNVDEENWHYLKVQAAKEKITLGQLFNRLVQDYKEMEKEEASWLWKKIFSRAPLLGKEDAKRMHKAIQDFRKEYTFEG